MINIKEIMKHLPYRYPMILVDKVLDIKLNEEIKTVKNISGNESCFSGHFPGQYIFPGVFIIEAMCQSASLLINYSKSIEKNNNEDKYHYLGRVNKAKFINFVRPGDRMIIKVKKINELRHVFKFSSSCTEAENGKIFCKSEITIVEGGLDFL